MASVIGVIVLAAATFWLEMPGLMQRKRTREIAVFLVLLLVSTAVYIALVLNVPLPNPLEVLKISG